MKDIGDRERIVKMYQEGMGTIDIAKEVGLTKGAIYSILKCRGIPTRSCKEGIKAKYPNGRVGELASNWKGGRVFMPHPKKYSNGKGNWQGGRYRTSMGYIYIYSPDHPFRNQDKYVMEHRLAMEKEIGRYLTKDEIVHHKNGDKADNRIENLMLTKKGAHTSIHFEAIEENDKLRRENVELKKRLQEYEGGKAV